MAAVTLADIPNRIPKEGAARLDHGFTECVLRRVQFPPSDDVFEAAVMRVGEEPDDYTLAAVAAEVRYLLPNVERFGLLDPAGAVVEIPWELLQELVPVEFVDERQLFVGPVSPAAWSDVLATARELVGEPATGGAEVDSEAPNKAKPWWKFW